MSSPDQSRGRIVADAIEPQVNGICLLLVARHHSQRLLKYVEWNWVAANSSLEDFGDMDGQSPPPQTLYLDKVRLQRGIDHSALGIANIAAC